MGDTFVYFCIGMAVGFVIGIMSMAIILAIGRNIEETE